MPEVKKEHYQYTGTEWGKFHFQNQDYDIQNLSKQEVKFLVDNKFPDLVIIDKASEKKDTK